MGRYINAMISAVLLKVWLFLVSWLKFRNVFFVCKESKQRATNYIFNLFPTVVIVVIIGMVSFF